MEDVSRDRVQSWLVALADGDRSAFEPLFDHLWPRLRSFALKFLPRPEDAEDAVQQALANLFSRAGEFDRSRDALSWIFGIVAWECRSVRKRAQRRREDAPPSAIWAALSDGARGAEDELLGKELLAAAAQAFGELRPRDRETLLAVAGGERPAVSGATFRKRLERARERLRSAWRMRYGS